MTLIPLGPFSLTSGDIHSKGHIKVFVNGPGDWNRLHIFTGVAVLQPYLSDIDDILNELKIEKKTEATFQVQLLAKPTENMKKSSYYIGIASLQTDLSEDDADEDDDMQIINPDVSPPAMDIYGNWIITFTISVSDNYKLNRVAYQVNVLSQTN